MKVRRTYTPNIILAIGGIGGEILKHLIDMATRKRIPLSKNFPEIHYIDSDVNDLNFILKEVKKYNAAFKSDGETLKYYSYKCGGADFGTRQDFIKKMVDLSKDFEKIWPGLRDSIPVTQAAANRSNGIAILYDHLFRHGDRNVAASIVASLRNMMLEYKSEESGEDVPNIWIIGSIYGGTSSAMFLPLAILIRRLIIENNLGVRIYGIIPLFEACDRGARKMIDPFQKDYAILREYMAIREIKFMQTDNRICGIDIFYPPEEEFYTVKEPVFDRVFLIGEADANGIIIDKTDYNVYLYNIAFFLLNLNLDIIWTNFVNAGEDYNWQFGSFGFYEVIPSKNDILKYQSIIVLKELAREYKRLLDIEKPPEDYINIINSFIKFFFNKHPILKNYFHEVDFLNVSEGIGKTVINIIDDIALAFEKEKLKQKEKKGDFYAALLNLIDTIPQLSLFKRSELGLDIYIKDALKSLYKERLNEGFGFFTYLHKKILKEINFELINDRIKQIDEQIEKKKSTIKRQREGNEDKKISIKTKERFINEDLGEVIKWVNEREYLKLLDTILHYLYSNIRDLKNKLNNFENKILDETLLERKLNENKANILIIPRKLENARNIYVLFKSEIDLQKDVANKFKKFIENSEYRRIEKYIDHIKKDIVENYFIRYFKGEIKDVQIDTIIEEIERDLKTRGYLENYEKEKIEMVKDATDGLIFKIDVFFRDKSNSTSQRFSIRDSGNREEKIAKSDETFGELIINYRVECSDSFHSKKHFSIHKKTLEKFIKEEEKKRKPIDRERLLIHKDWNEYTLPELDECGPHSRYVPDILYLVYHSQCFIEADNTPFLLKDGVYKFKEYELSREMEKIVSKLKEHKLLEDFIETVNKVWKVADKNRRRECLKKVINYLEKEQKYRVAKGFKYRLENNWHLRERII